MDLPVYSSVDRAVGALRIEHETLEPLDAVTELFDSPAFYDPDADRVLITEIDSDEPNRVMVRRIYGWELANQQEIIEYFGGEIETLNHRRDDADNTGALSLATEVARIHLASIRRHGSDDSDDDEAASAADVRLVSEMDRLRDQISLLASIRALNIQGRLDARNNRHGSKRETARALGLTPQNIQDVLHAFRKRFNIVD